MGEVVRHNPDKEEAIWRTKIRTHAVGKRHQDALRGHRMRKMHRKATSLESKPRLKNPALCGSDFALFVQDG